MNKIALIVGVFLLVALLGGGYYYYTNTNNKTTNPPQNTNQQTQDEQVSLTGNLKDLLSKGEAYECTLFYKNNVEGLSDLTGKIYVDAKANKFKGEFNSQFEGQQFNSYTISDGEYLYTWTDLQQTGLKVQVPKDQDLSQTSIESSEEEMAINPLNENYDFNCKKWSVDNNMFNPPSNIEFNELPVSPSDYINDSDLDLPQVDCSVCDMVPEESAKQQCLQSLGCN